MALTDQDAGHRRVVLRGGRRLQVRPVAPGDVDGLVALYGTLSAEDRHLRFFSAFVADRDFCEHLATVERRGGFGVVAVEDGGRIVGEANYERLPDGDGELGMVVATDRRGGLGSCLLDTLLAAASARGVPNLEADVLVTNARMLSLLRARGYASLPSEDWVSLRLMVGTAGPTPVWPKADRAGPIRPGQGCWSRRPAAAGRARPRARPRAWRSSAAPGPAGRVPHAPPSPAGPARWPPRPTPSWWPACPRTATIGRRSSRPTQPSIRASRSASSPVAAPRWPSHWSSASPASTAAPTARRGPADRA
jgi:ribosomal protein S18 acetylase RimI-like enzyme